VSKKSKSDIGIYQKILKDSDIKCHFTDATDWPCCFMAQVMFEGFHRDIYLCWTHAAVIVSNWTTIEFVDIN